jgi:hypothetical protein
MKKWVFSIDITLCFVSAIVLIHSAGGCSQAQKAEFQRQLTDQNSQLQTVAKAVTTAAPAIQTLAVTLPLGTWFVLGVNIVSSIAAAIVAMRKDTTKQ